MPPFVVDPQAIRTFANEAAFEAWLSKHHARKTEVWIKIFKKSSGTPSIDASQAIDVALCWGWIDGIRKGLDDVAFLQRYTPRKSKSLWSQINRERVARLIEAGRMTEHGLLHVDAAKADGRWDAAYPSPKAMELPDDFLTAVRKRPKARATLEALGRQDRFFMAYRLFHATAKARPALVLRLLALLEEGVEALVAASPRGKALAARQARAAASAAPSKQLSSKRKAAKKPAKKTGVRRKA